MIASFENATRPPRQTSRRRRQFSPGRCGIGIGLLLAVSALQPPTAAGEPLSAAPFAVSAAPTEALVGAFGFLEFDWAPGPGIPGFGPLPDAPSPLVLAEAGK